MPVHGIDLSPDMVAQLQAKPGADAIGVTIGDFSSTRVDGTFRVAYLVFNTIENLTSQDDQVACFSNVADHLEPGGCFVVEVEVPPMRRLPPGDSILAFDVTPRTTWASTRSTWPGSSASRTTTGSPRVGRGRSTMPFRYVWPAELDLMARIAGMRLRERWGDWKRGPFTSDSTAHVSVWEKPAP